jgi:hypothetical protein
MPGGTRSELAEDTKAIMRILRSRFQRAGRHVASETALYRGNNREKTGHVSGRRTDWDIRYSHARAPHLIDNRQTLVAAGEIASSNATEGHRGHVPRRPILIGLHRSEL